MFEAICTHGMLTVCYGCNGAYILVCSIELQTGCANRCRHDITGIKTQNATYLLVLLNGFDLGAGFAFGEASPGAFGAVACPGWFEGVEPFIFGPLPLVWGACAFETCRMHAVLDELNCLCWHHIECYL